MPYITNKNASAVEMATSISTWNLTKVLPVKTLFDPHQGAGVVGMAFSEDSKYLVTLGADYPQTIAVWDWSSESETPIATTTIEGAKQVVVQVNSEDPTEIVSTGPQGVFFFTWDEKGNMVQHVPFLTPKYGFF
jgi:cilia- and flagella-associated protein 251